MEGSMKYTVVENAGYEGEREIHTFSNIIRADRFIARWYGEDEIETLHVLIRRDWIDEDGTKHSEY
jgi:hypothetical protein